MAGKTLLAIAALTVFLEITLDVLARRGVLGYGDTRFLRHFWSSCVIAMLATLTGLIAAALGIKGSVDAWIAVATAMLSLFALGMFLSPLFL